MRSRDSSPSPAGTTSARLFAVSYRADGEAWDTFFRRYLPVLRRWAHSQLRGWMRGGVDASDVVQDAIARTLARLDLFQPKSRRELAAYLRTAVRNRIADEHRRAARWMTTDASDALPARTATPFDLAVDVETRRRYLMALRTLTPREYELLVGHLELGYTHAQLACMIGRSPNAARMALARAMARLAARMGGR